MNANQGATQVPASGGRTSAGSAKWALETKMQERELQNLLPLRKAAGTKNVRAVPAWRSYCMKMSCSLGSVEDFRMLEMPESGVSARRAIEQQ